MFRRMVKCRTSIFNTNFNKNPVICLSNYSSSKSLDISGIYPPITTPFNIDESINLDKLSFNLNKWSSIAFKGYVVLGSTGEFVSLSTEEKVKLVKCVKEQSNGKLVIAGSGCESTHETISLTNKMAAVGADAALVISPHFYKGRMTDDVLLQHYTRVADSSRIPIILYSVPANTGLDLSASLVAQLARHPNIIGLKDSGGDITKIGQIVHKTKEFGFQVLAGSAGFLYPALCIGCVGGVLALANPLGHPLCELFRLSSLDGKQARDLQLRLITPNLAVTKVLGVPGVKAAMDAVGLFGGPCRSPLVPLSPQQVEDLCTAFQGYL